MTLCNSASPCRAGQTMLSWIHGFDHVTPAAQPLMGVTDMMKLVNSLALRGL